VRYIIYCDESSEKGKFYSNFYGGALLRASDREAIEAELRATKERHELKGELKWTKISEYNEAAYRDFADRIFDFVEAGQLKIRLMFTQNINRPTNLQDYQIGNEYFLLYYQFIKHAFGLRYCNPECRVPVTLSIFLDDVPDTDEKLNNFKDYLSSLSLFPIFRRNKIRITKDEITDVDSSRHIILQAVDVVLGAMQFRLNDLHKEKPKGSRKRGKRTRAKERVYKHINTRVREIYPHFNTGTSTGQADGPSSKWLHPYRHWCFVPSDSIEDLSRGKKKGR